MTRSRRPLLAIAALTPLLVSACGGSGSTAGSPGPSASSAAALTGSITVFAASSLTGSFTTLATRFENKHPGTRVTFSFGASSTLAQQITSGAPADVFASASAKNMTDVVAAGTVAGPTTFANNLAEVAVAPASAGKVTSLADLAKPGITVSICQPQVPCGALTQKILGKAKVTVTPVTFGLDDKRVLATVVSGEVDAGIVYVTDIKAARGTVVGVEIPTDVNASTAYPIATVKGSKNLPLAKAFEDYVLSGEGQGVLSDAGFARP